MKCYVLKRVLFSAKEEVDGSSGSYQSEELASAAFPAVSLC